MIIPEKVKNVDAHYLLPPKLRSDGCNRMRVALWGFNGSLWSTGCVLHCGLLLCHFRDVTPLCHGNNAVADGCPVFL